MTLTEEMKQIFNAMREGILIIDTEGVIVFGNEASPATISGTGGLVPGFLTCS